MNTRRFARSWQRWCGLTALVLLTALLGGCGGSGPYPVEGRVVWKDGSAAKELEGGQIVFDLPEKQTSARGIIQADGTFRLTTNKPNDGALAGDHKVLVLETRKQLGGPDGINIAPGVMDARFYDPRTSDLQATVKPGTNKVTLTVDRAPRR
jgi:hypothetical protein